MNQNQLRNAILALGVVGSVYLYTKVSGSTSSKSATHPAFVYPAGSMMDDQTEDNLVMAILKHRGYNKELKKKDGSMQWVQMLEEDYRLLLADFDAAIEYYRDPTGKKRPGQNLEKIRDNFVKYRHIIVAKPEGVGMGPISGFSGVY